MVRLNHLLTFLVVGFFITSGYIIAYGVLLNILNSAQQNNQILDLLGLGGIIFYGRKFRIRVYEKKV